MKKPNLQREDEKNNDSNKCENGGFFSIIRELLETIFLIEAPFSIKILATFSSFYSIMFGFVSLFGEVKYKNLTLTALLLIYSCFFIVILKIAIGYIENSKNKLKGDKNE